MTRRNDRRFQNGRRSKRQAANRRGPDYQNLELRQLLAASLGRDLSAPLELGDVFARDAVTVDQMLARTQIMGYVAHELVVAVEVPRAKADAAPFVASIDWSNWTGLQGVTVVENMMTVARGTASSVSLVRLDLGTGGDPLSVMRRLDSFDPVLWSSPNFRHDGPDPRELVPNDPSYGSQYHHPLMSNHLAWDLTLGNPAIRVGVTDDGVSLPHVDLAPNIWVNPGEIAGNGIDDDSNGYIDDVNGWDFSSGNNDPNPTGSNDHGTHVAGIAAGRTNNGIGIAGVAGLATIVPLQFYGGTNGWTAAIINSTYRYAADNGVQIVTTSYNVDGWVGDPVFTAGLQYMYDAGVLHFNSAGNNNQLNPARQVFEQSIFVSSTDSADIKSSFTNYGTGIDVAAPGSNIYSTILGNSYGLKSGTSMSTPNAAGAAALLWGANPGWNAAQVAARLLGTATNIDALNPAYAGLLGTGRVNTHAALTTALAAPRVKTLTGLPAAGSTTATWNVGSFTVSFNQILDPATVNNSSNFVLREAGADGVFGNGDDKLIGLTANKTYRLGTNDLAFTINGGSLEPGKYQLSLLSGGLRNPFSTPLDGDGNGVGGDNYNYQFTLEPVTEKLAAQGALAHQQKWSGTVGVAGQQDDYFIGLDAGQTLTVTARATGVLVPTIQVRNPAGTLIASVTASGAAAWTSVLPVTTAGRYRITFGGNGSSTGGYDARVLLNAGAELEELGSATNNTRLTAQSIDSSALALGTRGGDRLGVVGQLPGTSGNPLYSDGFESGVLGSQWATASSTAGGRIQLTGANGTAAGSLAMLMDTTSATNTRNEATWTVNLSGLTAATLRFWEAAFSDEVTTMPVSFTGNSNSDGVAISANGTNWFRVWSPTATQTAGLWTERTVDLVAAATTAGISLNSTFRIRFQQYDNAALPTDGRGYDEVAILVPAPQEDWYSFTLADGESAAIAAARTGTTGTVSVQLYDNAGTLVRSGVATDNLSGYISRFQDTTSNGVRDTWYVRVQGSTAEYSMVVARQAEFDAEPNNTANATAQDIQGLLGAMGYATTTADFYRFTANSGESIGFRGFLPGSGPDLFVNGLSSTGGAGLLRMELVAPGGATVASGTDTLNYTATTAGTHYLRIFAQSGSGGEYFVERVAPSLVHVENGTVANVGETWRSVSFNSPFVDPVVIVSPPSYEFSLPILAGVSNVTTSGFQVRLFSWQFDGDPLFSATLSYMVFERGVTDLGGGARLVAERLSVEDQFGPVSYAQAFAGQPAVVSTVSLGNNQSPRAVRLNASGSAGYQIRTQFEENPTSPADELTTVYVVSMTPGRYTIGNSVIESGLTPASVTQAPYSLTFLQPFAGTPAFAAQIQTYNEADSAVLRQVSISPTGASIFIQEEQSFDMETSHAAEQVGYVAMRSNTGSIPPSFLMLSPGQSGGGSTGSGDPGEFQRGGLPLDSGRGGNDSGRGGNDSDASRQGPSGRQDKDRFADSTGSRKDPGAGSGSGGILAAEKTEPRQPRRGNPVLKSSVDRWVAVHDAAFASWFPGDDLRHAEVKS